MTYKVFDGTLNLTLFIYVSTLKLHLWQAICVICNGGIFAGRFGSHSGHISPRCRGTEGKRPTDAATTER